MHVARNSFGDVGLDRQDSRGGRNLIRGIIKDECPSQLVRRSDGPRTGDCLRFLNQIQNWADPNALW
jgi:hypothetical protein